MCCCEASLLLQCSFKISLASRGCKSSCCSLFCTLYLGKINFNRMHWFELIINGSSKLMKERVCAYTIIYVLHSIFMLVRGACYRLSMRWFSLEEERVMQQSSVIISLSVENQGINPVGDSTQVTQYLNKQSRTLQPTR